MAKIHIRGGSVQIIFKDEGGQPLDVTLDKVSTGHYKTDLTHTPGGKPWKTSVHGPRDVEIDDVEFS